VTPHKLVCPCITGIYAVLGVKCHTVTLHMHSLLKHKMLQLTLKISLYMAPTCFGPFGPSSGSIRQNLAKVTVFVEIISKNISLKLCCAVAICASVCSVCTGMIKLA
jgi:hypothetical protein